MAYLSSVAITDNQTGFSPRVYPLSGLKVVELTRQGGAVFSGTTLDTFRHILSGSNGGTGSIGNGLITLSTGTGSNASVILQSSHPFRYITGRTMAGTFTGYIPDTGSIGNIRRLGFYTSSDGFFFQLSGSVFGVGTRKGGVDTVVNNGSFNGNLGSTFPVSTNLTQFEIYYTSINAYFFINSNLLHKIEYTSSSLTNIITLPFTTENINSGSGAGNIQIFGRGWAVENAGEGALFPDYYHNSGSAETRTLKVGPGELSKLIINQKGGGGNTLTIVDSASGSVGPILAVVDVVNLLGELNYGISFFNGLTYVLAGASSDFTILWT